MEFASRLRWIIVIFISLLALVLVGWGIASIAKNVFKGGSKSTTSQATTEEPYNIETTASARFITEGPIVASDKQRSYVIEVTQKTVTMKLYKAYGQILISEKSYPNTLESYNAFLSALDKNSVTSRIKDTTAEEDFADEGVCATGKRYIIELDSDLRRWGTSCSAKQGTSGAKMSVIKSLFKGQVADYNTIVSGTGL